MSDWNPPVIDRHEPTRGLPDAAPRDGGAADEDGWAGMQLDEDVIEEGNQLGAAIDVENDADNGGIEVWGTDPGAEPPTAPVTTVEQVPYGPVSSDMDPSAPTPDEPLVLDGIGDPVSPEDEEDLVAIAQEMTNRDYEIDQELGVDQDYDGRGLE